MNYKAIRYIFAGRVQGVGFRYTALRIVRPYEITGFVRNLPDGSVEMLAQGPEGDIQMCINDLQEYFGSSIREIKTTDSAPNPSLTDFRIEY